MKEWPQRDEMEQLLTFFCHLKPNFGVMVPLHVVVGDLKRATRSASRDTYCIVEGLMVLEITEFVRLSDEEFLFGVLESGAELCVRGIDIDLGTSF